MSYATATSSPTGSLVSTGRSATSYYVGNPQKFNLAVYGDFSGTWILERDTGDGPIPCGYGSGPVPTFTDTNFGSQVLEEPGYGARYYINVQSRNSGTLFYRFGSLGL